MHDGKTDITPPPTTTNTNVITTNTNTITTTTATVVMYTAQVHVDKGEAAME